MKIDGTRGNRRVRGAEMDRPSALRLFHARWRAAGQLANACGRGADGSISSGTGSAGAPGRLEADDSMRSCCLSDTGARQSARS
jgi:hypothetical protein